MFDKSIVGNRSGGLLHVIWLEYGPKAAMDFLTDCQLLVDNWLVVHGFSCGVTDTIADELSNRRITNTL